MPRQRMFCGEADSCCCLGGTVECFPYLCHGHEEGNQKYFHSQATHPTLSCNTAISDAKHSNCLVRHSDALW